MSRIIVAGRVYVQALPPEKKRLKREYLLEQAQREDRIPSLEEVIDHYWEVEGYEDEMSEEEFREEVERLYEESVTRVRWRLNGEDIYRGVKLPQGVDPRSHDGLGIFWSLSRDGVMNAVADDPSVIYHARVKDDIVSHGGTVWANSLPFQGPDEEEVKLHKHAPIWVYGFYWPNGDYEEIEDWRRV